MMRFDGFTEGAQDAAARAYDVLQRYGHNQVDTEHMLLGVLEQPTGAVPSILEELAVDIDAIKKRVDTVLRASPKAATYGAGTGQVFITPRIKRIIDLATEESRRLNDKYITPEHLFLAILSERNTAVARILADAGVHKEMVYDKIVQLRAGRRVTDAGSEVQYRVLVQHSRDLTEMARNGKLDPVIGRDSEIMQAIQILSRRRNNSPLIVGGPGVGKTAITHGLAQRLATGDVPQNMLGKKLKSLSLHSLMAGARFRGDAEERTNAIIEEVRLADGDIVLFIDDLHEHIGKTASPVIDVLQSALARGDLQLIGTTTIDGYEEHFKTNALFARAFAPIFVRELSVDDTIAAIRALRPIYEAHHHIAITDEAIETAVRLSDRYIKERYQPDKSIQIIDEAAAALHLLQLRLPPSLQSNRVRIEKLRDEEEQAGLARDYSRAAEMKAQRLELEAALEAETSAWQRESGIPDRLSDDKVLDIVSQSVGISKDKLTDGETPLSDLSRLTPAVEMEGSAEDLQLGEQFRQKFKVIGLIGRGGIGEVWRVKNLELDRDEVVKVLPPGLLQQSRRIADRFRREAQMAAKLNHRNIVTIYDTGEGSGRRYIAMEYVSGPNLAQVIDRQSRLSVEEVQAIAIQICDALDYAHGQSVIHRDIKPSNILMVGDVVKVALWAFGARQGNNDRVYRNGSWDAIV